MLTVYLDSSVYGWLDECDAERVARRAFNRNGMRVVRSYLNLVEALRIPVAAQRANRVRLLSRIGRPETEPQYYRLLSEVLLTLSSRHSDWIPGGAALRDFRTEIQENERRAWVTIREDPTMRPVSPVSGAGPESRF